ncbi:MAG: hypothetical protein IT288_09450 [Bdellovibrionales bacterium]|nr:hypothetical protein [Bdellovibrionales bacterium]
MANFILVLGLLAGGVVSAPVAQAFEPPRELSRVSVDEVAQSFQELKRKSLVDCLSRWEKDNNKKGRKVVGRDTVFTNSEPTPSQPRTPVCRDALDLNEIVKTILDRKGKDSARLATMIRWFKEQALLDLGSNVDSEGFFKANSNYKLLYFGAVEAAQDRKAEENFREPGHLTYAFLRSIWSKVRESTTLDRGFFNPVQLDPAVLESDELFGQLRKAFELEKVGFVTAGLKAIDDFWQAHEGPEGDPAFAPLAQALKGQGILKRFYFNGGEEHPFPWSRNVLVVIDEHHQAWGFYMGYSE